jgi:hypothetical protein
LPLGNPPWPIEGVTGSLVAQSPTALDWNCALLGTRPIPQTG